MKDNSIQWFQQSTARALRQSDKNYTPDTLQHIVAVEAGFESWKAMLEAPPIERQLAIVMAEYPELSNYGIGMVDGHKKKAPEERVEIHRQERGALRRSVADVSWTVEWLRSNIEPRETINRRHSSYGLKHMAERHSPNRYLSNGVFIAAALIVGYRVQFNGTPNPWFRDVREVDQDGTSSGFSGAPQQG